MRCGDYNFEDGLRLMKKVLEGERPTAVIGINDIFAAGVMQAIYEAGLRVPEDISAIGFDNTYISRIASPSHPVFPVITGSLHRS